MVGFRTSFGTVATILLVCAAITVVSQAKPDEEAKLDLSLDMFQEFFVRLHSIVDQFCVTHHREGKNCILPYDRDNQGKTAPPHWIRISLYDNNEYKATLYLRSDTLYLLAFADKDGIVHYMNGYDDVFSKYDQATALPFSERYPDLTDRAEGEETTELLQMVALGKAAALAATNDLSNYDSSEDNVKRVKRAILAFCIMFAESLRFKPVAARCRENWEGVSWLTKTESELLMKWSDLSRVYITRSGSEKMTKFLKLMAELNVEYNKDLGGILDCLLLPREKKKEKGSSACDPSPDSGSSGCAPGTESGSSECAQSGLIDQEKGSSSECPPGTALNTHVIRVAAAEDVKRKILSFSRRRSRSFYIMSASGVISNVTLRQPYSLGGTVTYEGRFELLSLSGHFTPTNRDGSRNRSGGMSVAFADAQGRIIRGRVAGLLVAAAPVQIKVGRFFPRHSRLDQNWTANAKTPVPVPGG